MESALQAKCLKEARRRGCLAFKIEAASFVGFPDVMVIQPGGRIFFVEMKTKTGRLRPSQRRRINQLKELNVEVYVINDYQEFIKLL
jgi:hypothetical protein